MDKDKIIEVLESLPQEFYDNAYIVSMRDDMALMLQMKYNSELVRKLMSANRWGQRIEGTGYAEFKRDDGIEITMT